MRELSESPSSANDYVLHILLIWFEKLLKAAFALAGGAAGERVAAHATVCSCL